MSSNFRRAQKKAEREAREKRVSLCEGDSPLHVKWRYINARKENVKVLLCRVVRENVKGGTRVGLNQRSDKQENVKKLSFRLVREHEKGWDMVRFE